MSAFLGPIHSWLFRKIKFQDSLTNMLIELSRAKGWNTDLENIVTKLYGNLEDGALEEIVDPGNIHGWLQERVSLVENRLAYVVTSLAKEDQERLPLMEAQMEEYGKHNQFPAGISPGEAFQELDNLFLNGMPCDRVNEIVKESDNEVVWKQMNEIHEGYWSTIGGDVNNFYTLRSSLINGILSQTGLSFEEPESFTYRIQRRI